MSDHQNIDSIILASIGITQGARKLAEKVYSLEEADPNIQAISFSRNTLPGHGGTPYLIANVQLKQAFANRKEFTNYLTKHDLPEENILQYDNPPHFSLQTNAGTTNAFSAQFYQAHRIRADEK